MLRRQAALLTLPLICALMAGCAGASGASGRTAAAETPNIASRGTGGLKTVTLQSGGHARTYLLYVPPGDARNHRLPLVLVLHGAGDTAANTVGETGLLSVGEHSHNMILVFPQGYQDTWNEGAGHTPAEQAGINDVAFVAAILRRVETNYAVDARRIVATGFSNGALMTEDLGCALSRQLTLIAPVEGQLPDSVSATCHPQSPVSLYEVHGTADAEIPYGGGHFNGIGGGTTVLSAPDSAARWAALDHCSGQPASSTSGALTFSRYNACHDRVTVTLVTINGGQHVWPTGFGPTLAGEISSMSRARTAIR